MSEIIDNIPRRFKMGATILEDPDPSATPEDALALYERTYPHLASCTLGEPELIGDGDYLQFPVLKPPAETKG